MRWFLTVSLSCVVFATTAGGTFVPLRGDSIVRYLFVRPSTGWLLATAVLIALLIFVAYRLGLSVVSRRAPSRTADARSGRWLAPLGASGLVAIGLLPAIPGISEAAAPISYFLYDLRWWWAATLVAWTAWRVDQLAGGNVAATMAGWLNRRSPSVRLLILDALLFALVVGWALGTSPQMRFAGTPFGDEPRYLRYCETWYQGHGVDVSGNVPFSDARLDEPSHVLHNVALFAEVVGTEARQLRSDVLRFIDTPSGFRWNRVPPGHNGFVTGKRRAGVYQLHQPGLSLLLLPGYYIDRHLLAVDAGYQGEFAADLVMTTTTMVIVLGLVAVCLFRLLRNATGADGPAWMGAALAAVTFPTAAFAFQLYPEMPACLFMLLAINYVCFGTGGGSVKACAVGLAVGMLTWLHPRFVILAALLACVAIWKTHGRPRTTFVLACGLVVFLLLGYNYHITGSWMPNALYAASSDDRQIEPGAIVDNLISYAFHGEWGLVPHAPWLFAVIPGLFVMVRTGRRTLAILVVLSGLALGVPAAGHALNPAGGTPGRFVMAVIPLMIWPVVVLAHRFWSSTLMRVAALVGAILSLDASLAYDWNHEKAYGPMLDAARSGWKLNLAFPRIREYFIDLSQPGLVVAAALALALAVASGLAWWRAGARRPAAQRRPLSAWSACAVVMLGLIAWSTVATYALGTWTRQEFMVKDVDGQREADVALGRAGRQLER